LWGYLLKDPEIREDATHSLALMRVRTVRRDLDSCNDNRFEDVLVMCDDSDKNIQLMPKVKKLQQFDVIYVKGVVNVLPMYKRSLCPNCGNVNVRLFSSSALVFPTFIRKEDSFRPNYDIDPTSPDLLLTKLYKEVSNSVTLEGTVVGEPEQVDTKNRGVVCRFPIGIDRHYYIKSQSETHADYPWIYAYGKEAEKALRHLKMQSVVLINGFMQYRKLKMKQTCSACGSIYTYEDSVASIVPYAIEYQRDYTTDEEIAEAEKLAESRRAMQAVADALDN
jgi:RNase P subunit RPR2